MENPNVGAAERQRPLVDTEPKETKGLCSGTAGNPTVREQILAFCRPRDHDAGPFTWAPTSLSEEARVRISTLGKTEISKIIASVQKALNESSTAQERLDLRRFLQKLCMDSGLLPDCISLKHIKCRERSNPIRWGSFADIFIGKLGGQVHQGNSNSTFSHFLVLFALLDGL